MEQEQQQKESYSEPIVIKHEALRELTGGVDYEHHRYVQ